MKKYVKKLLVLLSGCSILCSSCGTIVHGTKQSLSINTNPTGAKVIVGTQSCVTPCTIDVSRRAKEIKIIYNGKERVYELDKKFNVGTTIIGNILWLLPGVVIDIFSGGAYTIEPVNVSLENQSKVIFEPGNTRFSEIQKVWGTPWAVLKMEKGWKIYLYHGKVNCNKVTKEKDIFVVADSKNIVHKIVY